MSGFNTKERNNNGEYEITFYSDNKDDFKIVENLCRSLIGHNKPNTEGDLISREWLLERARYTNALECNMYVVPVSVIDNAPTVDLWQMRQEATENALKKAEVLYGRPQGEWKKDNIGIYCSVCKCHIDVESPFCPFCGADMRKGGSE